MYLRRGKENKYYGRKLEVHFSGYWYTALTIGMGVVALLSGNNVLYLIESLLLSGMIFSGILSERFVSAVTVEIHRLPATAEAPCLDRITFTNNRRFTLFCIEAGEWVNGEFESFAFISRLGPLASVSVPSRAVFKNRGVRHWQALAVATSYPFGFARKVKILDEGGQRLVWPARVDRSAGDRKLWRSRMGARGAEDFSEGEVRPMVPQDDFRDVIWTVSAKGGDLYVRHRQSRVPSPEAQIDLRVEPGASFESQVVSTAQPFHGAAGDALDCRLIVLDHAGRKFVRGRRSILNWLAVAEAKGSGPLPGASAFLRKRES